MSFLVGANAIKLNGPYTDWTRASNHTQDGRTVCSTMVNDRRDIQMSILRAQHTIISNAFTNQGLFMVTRTNVKIRKVLVSCHQDATQMQNAGHANRGDRKCDRVAHNDSITHCDTPLVVSGAVLNEAKRERKERVLCASFHSR